MAEVLITLVIIGVVAALTMPSLIQNHKKQETSARLKKFYSMMNQAIMLSETENGPVRTWQRDWYVTDEDNDYDYEANGEITKTVFLKYIAPYLKYTNIEDAKNFIDENGKKSGARQTIYLSDSSSFSLLNSGECVDIIFDINGKNKPNEIGKDKFVFLLCTQAPTSSTRVYCNTKDGTFCAYYKDFNTDRTKQLSDCKSSAYYCSGLLLMDGWEFKEDYPWKL